MLTRDVFRVDDEGRDVSGKREQKGHVSVRLATSCQNGNPLHRPDMNQTTRRVAHWLSGADVSRGLHPAATTANTTGNGTQDRNQNTSANEGNDQ